MNIAYNYGIFHKWGLNEASIIHKSCSFFATKTLFMVSSVINYAWMMHKQCLNNSPKMLIISHQIDFCGHGVTWKGVQIWIIRLKYSVVCSICKYCLLLRTILGIMPNGSINHACIIHELSSRLRNICDFCVKDFFNNKKTNSQKVFINSHQNDNYGRCVAGNVCQILISKA